MDSVEPKKRTQIAYFLIGNTIPQVLTAAMFLWLAVVATKGQFGQIVLLESVFQGLLIVFLLGMDKALERFGLGHADAAYARKMFGTATGLCAAIGLAACAAYSALRLSGAPAVFGGLQFGWIVLVILSATLAAIFQLAVSYQYVLGNARAFAGLRSARAIVFGVVLATAISTSSSTVGGKLVADLLSFLVPLALLLIVERRDWTRQDFEWPLVRSALPYGLPFVATLGFAFSLNYLDRFLVVGQFDAQVLAGYGLAQRMVSVVLLVASGIALVVPPLFYRSIRSEPEKVHESIRDVMRLTFWLSFIAMTAGPIAIGWLYGDTYADTGQYLPLLLVGGFMSIAISNSTALCLLHEHRSVANMLTGATGAILSVALNVVLLPRIGVFGAIGAYVSATSTIYYLQHTMSHQSFPGLPAIHWQLAALLAIGGAVSAGLHFSGGAKGTMAPVLAIALIISTLGMVHAIRRSVLI